MNLQAAARFFDKMLCTDAYDPNVEFYGQLDLYDDSKRDGVTVERRILSVSPDTVIPTRRTINIHGGGVWIVGDVSVDTWMGKPIRHKYVIHQSPLLGTLKTPKQMLSTGGTSLHSAVVWVKDAKEIETSSRLFSFMNAYFSTAETVNVGNILTLGTESYRIRNVFRSAAGVMIGECNLMPNPAPTTVGYTSTASKIYDAGLDAYVTASSSIPAIFERFQDSYAYESEAAQKYQEGDMLSIIQKSSIVAPQVGDTITRSGITWRVVSVADDGYDSWELQVRRA